MAAINISPTSASFSSSGGNGAISLSVETDNWHTEPQAGDIWMAQRRKTNGTWGDWVVFRIEGEKGADGTSAVPVYQGTYDSTQYYYGDSTRRDIVKYGGQYWIAKTNANPSPFKNKTPSASSTYWDSFGANFESVATQLLMAEEAVIDKAIVRILQTSSSGKRIETEGNEMKLYDASGKEKMLITGENLGSIPVTSKSFSSGTMTGTAYEINQTNTLISSSNFNITSINNTVELPEITVDVFKSAYSDTINASASLLIDNTVVASSPTYNGQPVERHIYLVIPAKALSLSTGTHTLKLQAQASSLNGTLSSISYPSSSAEAAGPVDISYNSEKVQIGANGFRAVFGASNYAEFVNVSSSPSFTIRSGNYALRVSSAGVQKSTDMNKATPTWTSL